ncbi:agmatinase family protein [Niabella drilacis]|uniref:Agmatinase n=1 Tax=Niabella drilacis (strain DSM 25811 / CCM 8410 / CCUG 62505 / LMG 26954 / E90) TaxID=1285928 RepID=A0A1G6KN59_NIADE|nr:agmatinase family protein [Niabella drilacis]SDC32490.1 agmatinase [Niabella drilacis]
MLDLTNFDQNCVANPNNNIFGLPSTEENADLIIINVPWEVTVSYGAGTARAPESILKASMQVDLYDPDFPDAWKRGYYLKPTDRSVLLKSDFLRKEAELYIDYISKGEELGKNQFMCRTIKEVNEGGTYLNNWVYEQAKALLDDNKLVGLLGGDHSTPLGLFKALAEKHGEFGILQVDAHCDLRKAYEGFVYSHASIMYNALNEIPELKNIIQVGVRDLGQDEWEFIKNSNYRVVTYFDQEIKERQFEGDTFKNIADEIISKLPQKVHISFDIDGLDPKLCPDTGTPVPGGFELDRMFFLFKKIVESGRQLIGFDLVEVGTGETDWNANVGARALYKLCNILAGSNQ